MIDSLFFLEKQKVLAQTCVNMMLKVTTSIVKILIFFSNICLPFHKLHQAVDPVIVQSLDTVAFSTSHDSRFSTESSISPFCALIHFSR